MRSSRSTLSAIGSAGSSYRVTPFLLIWLCSSPAPLSPAAKRARFYRKRRRDGIRPVKVLLHDIDIKALVYMGYLKPEQRQNPESLAIAVYCAVDMELDAAKYAIRTSPPRDV
jgi:hypothetical protein